MALAVVTSGAALSFVQTVRVANADLVCDDLRGVIYASVPGNARRNANSIVRIDPMSGTIAASLSGWKL